MAIADDLKAEVKKFFDDGFTTRDGQVVPKPEDLGLGNDAVRLEGAVLYADIAGSTKLVQDYKDWFAAKVYKSYLYCAARIIRSEGGEITSYDGDRIMAVYIGGQKCNEAVRSALKINYAVKYIVNPAIASKYPKSPYKVRHNIGVDTSKLFIARTGMRGRNDLVWIGRSANYAAKLSELSEDYTIRATEDVYVVLKNNVKLDQNKQLLWEKAIWTTMDDLPIYRANAWLKI